MESTRKMKTHIFSSPSFSSFLLPALCLLDFLGGTVNYTDVSGFNFSVSSERHRLKLEKKNVKERERKD